MHRDLAASNNILPGDDLALGHVFWSSRDAVIVGGPDNRIVHWNPAAEEMYGYTAEEAVGQPFDFLIPRETRGKVDELVQSFIERDGEAGYTFPAPVEMVARHKSGRRFHVEFSISPMIVNGEPYGFATIRDCSDRKRLEAERAVLLQEAQDVARRAEEIAHIKADLSALIVHELGTPLAAMRAMLDLLDQDDLAGDVRAQVRSSMRFEVHLLQRLVEDIRAAASMEGGEFSVHLRPVQLRPILEGAAASTQRLLANHDFRFEPAPDVMVMADPERIGQVLRNLLVNASKYTPQGTRVRLRANPLDGRVRIDVEDTGPGIAPKDLEHIFRKFGRGRDATGRRVPGMGLGLFLSRQITHQHGGELTVMSEPGTRTVFSFELHEAS